jgi:CubicO group peptidase (beta-lactamase class C family)
MGLGWHRSPLDGSGRTMVWHNGGTGGFRSFIGFVPEPPAGVVVLGNSMESVDPLALRLLRLLATR